MSSFRSVISGIASHNLAMTIDNADDDGSEVANDASAEDMS